MIWNIGCSLCMSIIAAAVLLMADFVAGRRSVRVRQFCAEWTEPALAAIVVFELVLTLCLLLD